VRLLHQLRSRLAVRAHHVPSLKRKGYGLLYWMRTIGQLAPTNRALSPIVPIDLCFQAGGAPAASCNSGVAVINPWGTPSDIRNPAPGLVTNGKYTPLTICVGGGVEFKWTGDGTHNITKTNRMQLVLFGMQNRILRSYLAAIDRIRISVMQEKPPLHSCCARARASACTHGSVSPIHAACVFACVSLLALPASGNAVFGHVRLLGIHAEWLSRVDTSSQRRQK
jgi:hypothetical protein